MLAPLTRLARPVASPETWRRWAHLILGGALLMPYWLAMSVLAQLLGPGAWTAPVLLASLLVPAVLTAFIPGVRALQTTAARELLGIPLPDRRPADWPDRWRTAAWHVCHLGVGGVVSGISLSLPPFAVLLMLLPFGQWRTPLGNFQGGPDYWWAPAAGLAALVALIYLAAGAGALLAWLAPRLLGPSAAQRMAELARRAEQLAERNRLARELHDSVGHALSVVTVQAAAAGRVLDSDPAFARTALAAIEEVARGALLDLDHVLGVLREDPGSADTRPTPDLRQLDSLLRAARAAGVEVTVERAGALDKVPAAVSREAYRIVQEGLTNALRHAGPAPVRLALRAADGALHLRLSNPLRGGATGSHRPGGGRGLRGIAERVAVLRGEMTSEAKDGEWRLTAQLPL